MAKIENEEVFKVLFDNDENKIWSGRPYVEHIKKKKNRKYLEDTEIFITKKRVVSLLQSPNNGSVDISNILISEVEYFFVEDVEKTSLPIANINLKVKHETDETIYSQMLFYVQSEYLRRMHKTENGLVIDKGWEQVIPTKECVYQIPNILDKEELLDILKLKLNIKEDIPPLKWRKKYNFSIFPFIY